ncbi:Bacteroides conjugative transposon TraJ protein [Myroides marinus]|uniref:Bacteroides conjugative transposon TraJ protein n=1 Tax=Myroides marinus TaxID=703342 RepID=A0A1H6YEL2_9FLAO|nr:conjugative transposon protein TraJ [Myroides marinus]SEJ39701.1 Bacteroides conjugative transposon TraJ protein [Myroides marinus]
MASDNLHEVLQNLYYDMIPISAQMASVAKSLAGLGALFYIGIKVWQALARAESIDVYPMLRPFALGICIMFFPTLVLGTLNTVLSPVVKGTHQILERQVIDMTLLQKQKDVLEKQAMLRNPETAYLISNEEFDKKLDELGWSPSDLATMAGMHLEKWQYDFKKNLRDAFREILEMLFQASALIIDTVRTFFLVVLSILGPIAFAISIWNGFEATLLQWLMRYISVYLWLPVADLFSSMLAKIQSLILERDMQLLSDPSYVPDTSNTIYVIFMLIGIVGYFTVPTVTSWVIQASGASGFLRNVNQSALKTGNIGAATAGATSGNITGRLIK